MRRVLPAALIALLASFPAFARGGGHGGGGGHAGGGGGHAVGGGGHAVGGAMHASGGAFRGGAGFRGGNFGYRGGVRVFRGGFGLRGYGYYPGFYGFGLGYYDPFWYSDWYPSYPYSSDYAPSYPPDYGYSYGGDNGGAPPVIINQQFQPPAEPNSVLRQYSWSPPPQPQASAPPPSKYGEQLYLVAFRDGVIRAVVAYWAQGATLHYVTMDHEQKQVALASVDRALSERLNAERNVQFQLPR